MKKAIIFDFDGVIVDTFEFCHRICQMFESDVNADSYRDRFNGNIIQFYHKEGVAPPSSTTPFFVHYHEALLVQQHHDEQMFQLLQKLHENFRLYIVSSSISTSLNHYLEEHNMRAFFEEVLGADFEASKVKKFTYIFEKNSFNPTDTLFITDTLGDIREAQHVHLPTIGVTWGYHNRERLEAGEPYMLVDTIAHLDDGIESFFSQHARRPHETA